jgi:hypothetical protein
MKNGHSHLNGSAHHVVPDNFQPILMCAECNKPTVHNFSKAINAEGHGATSKYHTTYYTLMYDCKTCGRERQFGLQSA